MLKENLEKKLFSIVKEAIKAGKIVGASILVAQDGSPVFEQHAGWANREEEKAVDERTLFRLASMTKAIVTAAAMALIEKGILKLDAPLTNWLPDFRPLSPNGKNIPITLWHLLTHTSGLSYSFLSPDNEPYCSAGISDGMDEEVLSLEENLKRLARVPLMFNPGEGWCYSLSTDVLGAVIEKACGKSLPLVVEEYVTDLLNMQDTTFSVNEKDRLALPYADNPGMARLMKEKDQLRLEGCGLIRYAPHRIFNKRAYPSGGSGMVGTARDYLIFLEALRKGGYPILQSESVKLMTQDAVPRFDVPAAGPGYGFGMGFAIVRDSEKANTPRLPGSYTWGGVYGTHMFVDPEMKLSVVILTNTALEGITGQFPINITRVLYDVLPEYS